MGLFGILTGIIVLSAALDYFNIRFITLPGTIGLLIEANDLSNSKTKGQ